MQADAAPRNSVDGNGADDEPFAYTVPQAAKKLAIGKRSMWHLVHTEQVESVKIGASRRIPREALLAYLKARRGAA
jgi:excisionase family DNA binding protein